MRISDWSSDVCSSDLFVDLGPDGYQFDAGGNLIDLGANPGAFEPFNFNPYNLLQATNEQWTATVLANYEISDSLEFYGRGSWAKSKVTTIVAPTGTFFFPFDINYRSEEHTSDHK